MLVPKRPNFISNKVIVTDGLIGGGKAMVSQIISSLPKVEMWIHKAKIEQICALNQLENISSEGAEALIKTWVDEESDNLAMLRNVNFRFSDRSSVFKYPRKWSYLNRLFKEGGGVSLKKFILNERCLHFMTHSLSGYSLPIFRALNDRLIFLRVTRCPMTEYLIQHLANWTERWGKDPRTGMILVKEPDNDYIPVPFFVHENVEKYMLSSSVDKAIFILEEWQRKGNKMLDKLKRERKSIIVEIPFEKFVFEPMPYIDEICDVLGTRPDKTTFKEMKIQNIPRKSLSDAPYDNYFAMAGWKKPVNHLSIEQEFEQSRKKILSQASKGAMQILDKITENYIKRYNIL